MKIRSVTCFAGVDETLTGPVLEQASALAALARSKAQAAGLELQSTRLAVPPLHRLLRARSALDFGCAFEKTYRQLGFDYGSVLLAAPALYADASALIQQTATLFVSLEITDAKHVIRFDAIHAAAEIIYTLAHSTAEGLGNFRFAAAANVPPGVPFFPVAYSADRARSFAFATEAADLAVEAFTQAADLNEARTRLVELVEANGAPLAALGRELAQQTGLEFEGIDFSLAPYPEEGTSLATALERLIGARFGTRGTLLAAALVTDALNRANFPRAGFCGLMLPVLEDWTMAQRSQENTYSLDSLLLYSTVCGTGLDTVPLAGEVTVQAILALLLDLAALAARLNKPLTARLIPVPGISVGELTPFRFEYFANARAFGINADPHLKSLANHPDLAFH